MTEDPRAFLRLIHRLESAVGRLGYYPSLDPFPCSTLIEGKPAIIEIQRAGKKIAEHAGLGDLTFIIAVTSQGPKTAGHIELSHGKSEVYVEISAEICGYKDAVLATLSHEIAHKVLHRSGIDKGVDGLELEFLTDVTAVYLGMGKIMLNGCECQSHSTAKGYNSTTTTTHSLKTGYVSQACFAFIYRVVCEMRRVPEAKMIDGLSADGRQALSLCEDSYREWFQPLYREPGGMDAATETLSSSVTKTQTLVAAKEHALRSAMLYVHLLRKSLNAVHTPLSEARTVLRQNEHQDNDRLRYLNHMEQLQRVNEYVRESHGRLVALEPEWAQLDKLDLKHSLSERPQHVMVECPIDGTKLRLPFGKNRLLVTCPSCKYAFMVTTAELQKESFSQRLRTRLGTAFHRSEP